MNEREDALKQADAVGKQLPSEREVALSNGRKVKVVRLRTKGFGLVMRGMLRELGTWPEDTEKAPISLVMAAGAFSCLSEIVSDCSGLSVSEAAALDPADAMEILASAIGMTDLSALWAKSKNLASLALGGKGEATATGSQT